MTASLTSVAITLPRGRIDRMMTQRDIAAFCRRADEYLEEVPAPMKRIIASQLLSELIAEQPSELPDLDGAILALALWAAFVERPDLVGREHRIEWMSFELKPAQSGLTLGTMVASLRSRPGQPVGKIAKQCHPEAQS